MTIANYLGTFTKVTQIDLDALPEGDIWKDPREHNWKNENGTFLFPTVRDALPDASLVIVLGDDGKVCTWGSGKFVPPPDFGSRMYELPEFDKATGPAFLGRIFDPQTGVLSDPPPSVPHSVTPGQATMALYKAGLLDQVRAAVAAHDLEEVRIWFSTATMWERYNPYVQAIGMELELSEEQIDDLFLAAAMEG